MHMLALPLILVTYFGVAIGEFPRLRMNRATIAFVGAVALVVVGILPLDAALGSLDVDTLLLLFAMMVINVHMRLAGFFDWVSVRIIAAGSTPRVLLALIVFASGVLSALFLNDTIVLMFTPLVLEVTVALKRNPIPYLIGLVTAANVGSTATIIGNPQNILIGMSSHIPFAAFLIALLPIALIGLVIVWGVLALTYRAEFASTRFQVSALASRPLDRGLLNKTLLLTGAMLAVFLLGAPIPLAALAAAAGLLITRRIDPDKVLAQVDWSLLVFFSGLFVVTGALSYTHWSDVLFTLGEPLARAGVAPLSIVTVILSNLVSNVPAVLLFRPLVPHFADPPRVWLTLAMASTLAGNLTLLGSVANLIVAESARAHGVKLSFMEYLKAGVPITVLTLTVGIVWLSL